MHGSSHDDTTLRELKKEVVHWNAYDPLMVKIMLNYYSMQRVEMNILEL